VAEVVAEEDAAGGGSVTKTLVAVAFVVLNFYTYNYLATNPVYPERMSFDSFPLELDEWSCYEPQEISDEVLQNLGVTDYLVCRFTRPQDPIGVDVYIGYHASQVREEGGGSGENSIHPPAHCLPGSGWDIIDSRSVPIAAAGVPQPEATVKRMIIAKGNARQLVYYWYQSRGRVISEDWQKIVYVGLDRALRSRTDGSLIRFTVPIIGNDEAAAEAAFRDLAPRILALLPDYVPE
jgi:EpsI family protein